MSSPGVRRWHVGRGTWVLSRGRMWLKRRLWVAGFSPPRLWPQHADASTYSKGRLRLRGSGRSRTRDLTIAKPVSPPVILQYYILVISIILHILQSITYIWYILYYHIWCYNKSLINYISYNTYNTSILQSDINKFTILHLHYIPPMILQKIC